MERRRSILNYSAFTKSAPAAGRWLLDVPGYTFRVWVTHRNEDPMLLWRDYNQRTTVEQRIEELKNDKHAGGFCAKKFFATEAAFLSAILGFNRLSLYQAQVTAKTGWRKPSTLRAAVFECGALLGRAGRKQTLRLSQNAEGLEKHKSLIDHALDPKIAIAPLLPRPLEPEPDFDTALPGGDGIQPFNSGNHYSSHFVAESVSRALFTHHCNGKGLLGATVAFIRHSALGLSSATTIRAIPDMIRAKQDQGAVVTLTRV